MDIIRATTAGFCMGVSLALQKLEEELTQSRNLANSRICTLGPIIHNPQVLADFESKGVVCINNENEIGPDDRVLIRAHGVPQKTEAFLRTRGAAVRDATCPRVKKAQLSIACATNKGATLLLFGESEHPEVRGLVSYAHGMSHIFSNESEIDSIELLPDSSYVLASQTTQDREAFAAIMERLSKQLPKLVVLQTICDATKKRQEEARQLAARCGLMVVIGDRQSSNTRRLGEICREYCPNVLLIERAEDLDLSQLPQVDMVGITAGASTPAWIIKEVIDKMSEEILEMDKSFQEMLEESFKTLNNGDKVTGTVVAITPTEVQVELGIKYPGYIALTELSDDPTVKVEDLVKVGDEIESIVMQVSDRDCMVKLSKRRLDINKGWEEIEAARENETVVEGFVTEDNKGGVVVSVKGVRVFVPASQTGLPRETPMSELLKQKVRLVITEVNRARRRVVGSISKVTRAERAAAAEKVWAEIEDGKRYTGTVKSLTSYGAFVDIGGVDGMVHISELSWSRIKHPSEVVKVGDTVDVYVISADKEKKKISLGMKDHSQDPWTVFTSTYQVGDTANVRIVKLMTFGAFAEVVPGVDGLIHISQLAGHRVEKPGDVVAEGDKVDVKITDVDMDNKKISLSIRALLAPSVEEAAEYEAEE